MKFFYTKAPSNCWGQADKKQNISGRLNEKNQPSSALYPCTSPSNLLPQMTFPCTIFLLRPVTVCKACFYPDQLHATSTHTSIYPS